MTIARGPCFIRSARPGQLLAIGCGHRRNNDDTSERSVTPSNRRWGAQKKKRDARIEASVPLAGYRVRALSISASGASGRSGRSTRGGRIDGSQAAGLFVIKPGVGSAAAEQIA